ncbi:MAG: hypothetical protein K0Q72_1526 [Armatimonadetes bacterium]|jgi:hypothetical protein|nr:hypothetical protein [Armatimonadota bacterium]
MALESRVFNVDALWRVERMYRQRLTDEPGDMVARVSLAWCLFLQALHRAGEENALTGIDSALEEAGIPITEMLELGEDDGEEGRAADRLLEDCLRQTVTVLQLSPDPRDRTDVERLQALIRLSGGEAAIADAEDQSRQILVQLTREMLNEGAASNRYRRVDGRRRQSPS